MRQIFFSAFVLSLSLIVHSQEGDAYHAADQEKLAKQRKAYNDAYIDALRYNRNTPTKQVASGDNKAAQELADLFAARAGKETSAQKAARLQQEELNYQAYLKKKAIDDQKSAEYFKDDQERRDAILLPMRQMYLEAGFQSFEAIYLSSTHLVSRLSSDKQKHIYTYRYQPQSFRAREAFATFTSRLETGSFEELFGLVNDFSPASYTALMAMEKLEKKFPGKTEVLKAAGLMITAPFWGSLDEGAYYSQYRNAPEEVRAMMLTKFDYWLKTYPEAAMRIASLASASYNPLTIWAIQSAEKKDFAKAAQFTVLALTSPRPWNANPDNSRKMIGAFGNLFWNDKYKGKVKLTAEDIKQIADNHEVAPRMVVAWLCSMSTDALSTSGYDSGIVTFQKGGFEAILKTLGEQGDADALNAYAVRVIFDNTKENPKNAVALLHKAAEGGSAWAMYNLLKFTTYNLKWYNSKDLPAAVERFKTFVPKTGFDKEVFAAKQYEMKGLAGVQ